MNCQHCDFVPENNFKLEPEVMLKKTTKMIRRIKAHQSIENNTEGDEKKDQTDRIIEGMFILYSTLASRLFKRFASFLRESPGDRKKWKFSPSTGVISRENVERHLQTSYQYCRLEYVASCIQSYFETKNHKFPISRHPFLIGGIPLSEETRNSFRGTIVYRKMVIPIFVNEGKKMEKTFRSPVSDEYYLSYPTNPCRCGSANVNAANHIYKQGSTGLWPFMI